MHERTQQATLDTGALAAEKKTAHTSRRLAVSVTRYNCVILSLYLD